ncbi:MAG: restriction endonuclease [Polaromonas sp.]|jgi:hypothetical protein|nr:restriction endonuclease [Polaromonas sp.]
MTDYIKSLEQLKVAIRNGANLNNYLNVASVFNCIGIQFDEVVGCILAHLQGGEDAGDVLAAKLQDRIARNAFISEYSLIEDNDLLESFNACESTVYSQIQYLISMYSEHMRALEDGFLDLRKNKRKLANNTEHWNAHIKEFAANNFIMAKISQQLMDVMPLQIKLHLAKARLNDIPGRFASQAYAILENRAPSNDSGESFEGDGYDYEHHIASIISKALPDADVEVTKASGDQGADIIVLLNRSKIVVQTKLYSSAVGNDAVQQAYAAKRYYNATSAVVVTNATYTKSANELAESLQVVLLHEDDVGPLFARAFS